MNRCGAENSNANPFVCGLSVPHQALLAELPRIFGAPFIPDTAFIFQKSPLNPSEVPLAKRVVKNLIKQFCEGRLSA
jgi:aldehyde:ferredoxin oxidoreductase